MGELNFVDLFSGAGGLSCGLELAGLNCLLGVDFDKHAIETFAKNHKKAQTFCGDIAELTEVKLKKLTGGKTIHLVAGGPPCQGFSTAGIGDPNDKRNKLFLEFVRIVKILKPNFVLIENVTGLVAKKNEATLKSIFKQFENLGYHLDVKVLSAEQHGVPEKRRRTVIIGTTLNTEITYPTPLKKIKTIGDAFKTLKDRKGNCHNHDPMLATIKSNLDLERIKNIPEGRGIRYQEDEEEFLPKKLRLGVNWKELPEARFRQTKYQRLSRNTPGPTIMTHRHSYFHPTENRYLTAREAAAIQSFPNDFIFCGTLSSQWRQIGNAVPPMLAFELGKTIIQMNSQAKDCKISKTKQKSRIDDVRKNAFVYRTKNKE